MAFTTEALMKETPINLATLYFDMKAQVEARLKSKWTKRQLVAYCGHAQSYAQSIKRDPNSSQMPNFQHHPWQEKYYKGLCERIIELVDIEKRLKGDIPLLLSIEFQDNKSLRAILDSEATGVVSRLNDAYQSVALNDWAEGRIDWYRATLEAVGAAIANALHEPTADAYIHYLYDRQFILERAQNDTHPNAHFVVDFDSPMITLNSIETVGGNLYERWVKEVEAVRYEAGFSLPASRADTLHEELKQEILTLQDSFREDPTSLDVHEVATRIKHADAVLSELRIVLSFSERKATRALLGAHDMRRLVAIRWFISRRGLPLQQELERTAEMLRSNEISETEVDKLVRRVQNGLIELI